ncbi:unnamed protein product [Cylicocyclus nassatus]|uniref:Peptidase M13 N-terminal domain-containing protein n=1 Tax=Cylicocyclus nassatus TaxID=53992 RepID=A0AA36H2Y5_CYLNA|nr:unnamed protein product [Cylicocyclus nassatus]
MQICVLVRGRTLGRNGLMERGVHGSWFPALLVFIICGVTSQQFCDENNPRVGNTPDYNKLAQLLRERMDDEVHPCDDFYQFACGRFSRKATKEDDLRRKLKTAARETHKGFNMFLLAKELFNTQKLRSWEKVDFEESLLTMENVKFPKAFEIAQLCYKSCLQGNQQWEKIGGTFQFVLRKIRDFGRYPLIDDKYFDSGDSNYTMDLTDLLVYYNMNRTTTDYLVPSISFADVNTRLKFPTRTRANLFDGDISLVGLF